MENVSSQKSGDLPGVYDDDLCGEALLHTRSRLAHVPSRYEERAAETFLASVKQCFAEFASTCLWLISIRPTRGDLQTLESLGGKS